MNIAGFILFEPTKNHVQRKWKTMNVYMNCEKWMDMILLLKMLLKMDVRFVIALMKAGGSSDMGIRVKERNFEKRRIFESTDV